MTTTTPEKTEEEHVRTCLLKSVAKIHARYAKGEFDAERAYASLHTIAELIEDDIVTDKTGQASLLIIITTVAETINAAEDSITEKAQVVRSLTIPALKDVHRRLCEEDKK